MVKIKIKLFSRKFYTVFCFIVVVFIFLTKICMQTHKLYANGHETLKESVFSLIINKFLCSCKKALVVDNTFEMNSDFFYTTEEMDILLTIM